MRDSDIDALSADGAQEAQPRTAAGRSEWRERLDHLRTLKAANEITEYGLGALEALERVEVEAAEPAPLDAEPPITSDDLGHVLYEMGVDDLPLDDALLLAERIFERLFAAGDKGSE